MNRAIRLPSVHGRRAKRTEAMLPDTRSRLADLCKSALQSGANGLAGDVPSDLNRYQILAESVGLPSPAGCPRIAILGLGVAGEAGEVADKIKKALRDCDGVFDQEAVEALRLELGDVLWYVSQIAWELGLALSSVADGNLSKLDSRRSRGTQRGSGDDR